MGETSLADRVALVTGASSGIGAEIARVLAARGVGRLILVARRRERLCALAAELGDAAVAFPTDLTRDDEVRALFAAEPRVDLLVNNAGVGSGGLFDEVASNDPESLVRLVDLNCRSVTRLTAQWLPGMVERDRGWILNVGSIAGMFVTPTSVTYGASKAFVNHFTESLRCELRQTGVLVHLLAPGPVRTEFFDPSGGNPGRYGVFWVPVSRVAEEAVAALLSDRPRHVPGLLVRIAAAFGRTLPLALARPLAAIGARRHRVAPK